MGRLALHKFAYFLSIILTFVLAVITVMGTFAGNVSPKLNMFMTAVGLILPILLILNAIIMIYWIVRLKFWFVLPTLALFANYNFISSTL